MNRSVDAFLRLQTRRAGRLRGEAQVPGHEGEITVRGWRFGARSAPAVGAGPETARRAYDELVVLKAVDRASTGLLAALAGNDEVREACLTLRRSGGEPFDFLTVLLQGARITSVEIGGSDNADVAETVHLSFRRVDIEYVPQGADGRAGPGCTFSDDLSQ